MRRSKLSFSILPFVIALAPTLCPTLFGEEPPENSAYDLPIDAVAPTLVEERSAVVYDFSAEAAEPASLEGWTAGPTVELSREHDSLRAVGNADDPYYFSPELSKYALQGDLIVKLVAKRANSGFAQIFTSERDKLDYTETRATRFAMTQDGEYREYAVPIKTSSPLVRLRIDLGLDAGVSDVRRLEIVQRVYAPLKFGVCKRRGARLDVELLRAGKLLRVESYAFPKRVPFERLDAIANDGPDSTSRRYYAFHEELLDDADRANWRKLESKDVVVRFAPDGSGAEVVRKSDKVRAAVLQPLADADRCEIELDEARSNAAEIAFRVKTPRDDAQETGTLLFSLNGNELTYEYDLPQGVGGPVVRALGTLEQGVLPGVEYLERGERSSSARDVNPDERARFLPAPRSVTAPFIAIVTDRGAVDCYYDDPRAQLEFAAPDFVDGDESCSRFCVYARKLHVQLRFAPPEPVEEGILWAVKQIGLPELPKKPRSDAEEDALQLAALRESAICVGDGWISGYGPGVSKDAPHRGTDFLSTLYELTGELPDVEPWNVGGANLRNYSAFLVGGRAELMKQWLNGEARNIRARQREDGSFRYSGKYLRGSVVDYASGDCARYVFRLLDHWRLTGNRESLESGLRGLDFINALKTPRGAQTWELSLHTPDILASSRCSYCNVIAYEATGQDVYLAQARRWAISGLAFVYLWHDPSLESDAIMRYASIPVFGTTDWIAPCWIGTPVQWCGLDYADALIALAKYDDSCDWRKIAEGLLICAEQMEYDSGDRRGLLPDSFDIGAQCRNPVDINPCPTRLVRSRLEGRRADVYAARRGNHTVAAPFDVRIENETAIVNAESGAKYQLLIDGERIVEIESQGEDRVDLRAK